MSVSTGSMTDVMDGQTMTLKGYSNRIETNVLTMRPNDYAFEPQYYFYNKISQHFVNDWEISCSRLRCGYIEEKYVNLSPNRQDAGLAYLEYSFDKKIYEVDINISFWGTSENLSTSLGDSAFIQYKDSFGNWINAVDLLNCNLSTVRTEQSFFEIDILEGTYGIRIIAIKANPNTTRNKGRICVGETKFINYNLI